MDENQKDICTYIRDEFHYPAYRVSMSTMYSLAASITSVLNSLVLISIWKTPSLHKPSYILIGSLALSDLFVGIIGEPLMIIYHIAKLRRWSLNNFCLVLTYSRMVNYAFGGISLLMITFISVDRLLAVKLRNRYQGVVSQNRVLRLLVACWITIIVLSVAIIGNLKLHSQTVAGLFLSAGIAVVILVVTITVCYSMAFYTLRKITSSSVSPSVQNTETVPHPGSSIDLIKYRRSLITMFVVFIATILFYTPAVSTYLAFFIFKPKIFYPLMPTYDIILICQGAADCLFLLNSAMNPILYLWRMRDIREAVKITVKTVFKIF